MPGTEDWEASWCCAQGTAQEMCEIQREKWLKLGWHGAFVAFGDLSTQERSLPLEPANATSGISVKGQVKGNVLAEAFMVGSNTPGSGDSLMPKSLGNYRSVE